MERIKLSKREKHVLRTLSSKDSSALTEFDVSSIDALSSLGLVTANWKEGHELFSASLTTKGKEYLFDNPHLYNPVDVWKVVSAVASIGTLITAIIALIIACSNA